MHPAGRQKARRAPPSQASGVRMANFIGGSGNDTLTGTAQADILQGQGGNDTLSGGAGADTLSGGDGNDILTGGRGADALSGGAGGDTFRFLAPEEAHLDRIVDFASGDQLDFSAIAGRPSWARCPSAARRWRCASPGRRASRCCRSTSAASARRRSC
ncbi:M10 family metallopeptidase C-terminal domain-containing protein [Teichococcus aestuarii]|uniref:M10 family metallopeptidase C-terminal domain-containing protein n=1 Tax=Teichococcus aestuarii TaxID=568898 RepID=UPI00360D24C6